jgi:hypothetical protein
MPFESKAQQRFAHANPEKFGGEEGLKEWDAATKSKKLPERKHPKPKAAQRTRHTARPR